MVACFRVSLRRLHPVRMLRLASVLGFCVLLFFTTLHVLAPGLLSPQREKPRTEEQRKLDYMAQYLDVYYRLLANQKDRFHVDVTLTNTGPELITTGNWSIYFHHMHYIDTDTFNKGGEHGHEVGILRIKHVNSYLFRIRPTLQFPNLTTDEYVTFRLSGGGWVTSRSDVIPNWYISVDGSSQSQPRILQSTASEDADFAAPFDDEKKWKRAPGDWYEPYSPEDRYIKHKIKDLGYAPRPILPTPVDIETQGEDSTVTIGPSWTIVHDKELKNEAKFLASRLQLTTKVLDPGDSRLSSKQILLHVDTGVSENSESLSAYELYVDPQQVLVTIKGRGAAGVYYGVQSLLQLLPLSAQPSTTHTLGAVRVSDHPRFPYRGLMVDVVRNFHTKQELFSLMDTMATYKLNVLHIHLADDEGWRLEIPGLPELTQVGGQRCHDPSERVCIMSMLGSGPFNTSSGSGYYTVADYTQLLQYAKDRHITIIPEFDMPGHSHAAIHSMEARYFTLAEQGHVEEGLRFLLSDLRDHSSYYSGQFFYDSAINPCIESTYRFVEFVMTAVQHMHEEIMPLTRIHFGGDEVPEAAYRASPACREFRHLHPHVSTSKQLKTYFVRRVADIAAKLNLGLQGWEDAYSTQGGRPIPVSDMSVPEVVSNAWYHIWGSGMESNVYQQANAGYKIVLTSTSHLYFDNPQEPDPEDWGLHWATRFVDTKRTFYYRPDSFYDNIDFGFWGERMSRDSVCSGKVHCIELQRPENIIGMSGALWTEEVRTPERLQQMLWPRMLAVAERAWHRAAWEGMKGEEMVEARAADWQDFANTLGYRELQRLELMGTHYYIPAPGVIVDGGKVQTNTMFPGLKVQWSKDKSSWYDLLPHTHLTGKVHFAAMTKYGQRQGRIVTFKVPSED